MQYGPLQIKVGEDEFEKTNRYAPFDDNMDNVMKMVNEMHNKQYEVKDFDMVRKIKLYIYSFHLFFMHHTI